jgi:hypothetical protein
VNKKDYNRDMPKNNPKIINSLDVLLGMFQGKGYISYDELRIIINSLKKHK